MKRNYGITILITGILTFLLVHFKYHSWTYLNFINAITITSLLLIISGALLYVAGGGFFSGIAYSFRRFYKRTSKKWQMLDESQNDEEYSVYQRSFSITFPFLVSGCILFLSSLIISFALF